MLYELTRSQYVHLEGLELSYTRERMKRENERRKSEMKSIFSNRTTTWKSIDYVAGWFMNAADYGAVTNAKPAFVSPNSICHGQQVSALWPLICEAS